MKRLPLILQSCLLAVCGIPAHAHWEHLLAPAREFPAEHALAAGTLTLPCDQRYSAEDMQRLATVFRAASA